MTPRETPPPFFVPGASDPKAAWDLYVEAIGGGEVEPLYEIHHSHDGDRYEVRVGEPRHCYPRETGPRGGYRPNAGHRRWATDSGTVVTAIMRTPRLTYVWSLPPCGVWANPSLVGNGELRTAVPFAQ